MLGLITGLYSGRRMLPTLADKSQYSDTHRLLVGGWSDAQARSYSAMPNLYSAARADLQHDLKNELVRLAATSIQAALAKTDSFVNLSWREVFRHWPKKRTWCTFESPVDLPSLSSSSSDTKIETSLAQEEKEFDSEEGSVDGDVGDGSDEVYP